MLIGCGCHCGEYGLSDVQSGSYRSDSFASSTQSLASDSLNGGIQSHCGACYNLPRNWTVTLSSEWFGYNYPQWYHDCRSSFDGTFILRPYGLAAMSPGAREHLLANGLVDEDSFCTVWQSTELAKMVDRTDFWGNPLSGCTDSANLVPRVELVSMLAPSGLGPDCRNTWFVLYVWWLQAEFFQPQRQYGVVWDWTVYARRNESDECWPRNCVRCFGAYGGGWAGPIIPRAYYVISPEGNPSSPIEVCPA